MILLDTNVLSALMLAEPDPAALRQLNRFRPEEVWISSVVLMEIRLGLLISPPGQKRDQRQAAFERLLREFFADRVASFDRASAEAAATLHAERRARGRVVETPDTQVAGIAIARRATICTRNVRHFEDAGVPVVNPWG